MSEQEAIVVLITAASRAEAEGIAETLIARRIAACVQILPAVTSIYRWQDRVERETEILLLVKTLAENFAELEQTVRENHSYEIPEIIAIAAREISAPYLKWIGENVK